MIQDSAF